MQDATDPRSWSGTPFFVTKALQDAGAEIGHIGPLNAPILKFQWKLDNWRRKCGLSGTLPDQSHVAAKIFARRIQEKLRHSQTDMLFSPAGSALISRLETDLPIVYTSDATVRLVADYYPEYSGISARSIRQADRLEHEAIARADLIFYPTRWVARSAVQDYGADPAKIRIQPYGANIFLPPSREAALAVRCSGPLRLLFVGVDWRRKGGCIALRAHHVLRRRGFDSQLTIIGCRPPDKADLSGVTVIPFLDKNDPVQANILAKSYLSADIFLLPTRSECYGIVFCEASAYGLPSLTAATGGVPDVVLDGENGFCLPFEADGSAYADKIEMILADRRIFNDLRRSSRDLYETRLNWESWGARLMTELQYLASGRQSDNRCL